MVLPLFCCVGSVMRVAGMPAIRVLLAPRALRETLDTVPDAAPPIAPALSPLDIGMIVATLWAGPPPTKMFVTFGIALAREALFG
ncbi:hypothetical protein WT60_11215 [Burkholderia sp. MSMB617WGS]|nr:hypothetical protein WS78_10490 [Burkholderia savannae]AOK47350.1 hypothetical protein WT60_11215 [Burkholderia sp. MSMB617WGS]KVG39426.1 hypothetical protein WS77_19630 [Burkholderia sp. MSMB0265]KVG93250.1 hypothetical protein WS83_01075 [Burkholderia sp. MSMB2042]KVG98087.1 hypothetical protein WS82_00790 [Burkholderia sp. MSMB2041]